MKFWRYLMLVVLLAAGTCVWGIERVPVTDREGAVRDTLVCERRGEVQLVSLTDVAQRMQWPLTVVSDSAVIMVNGKTLSLRPGNVFAKAGEQFVQLHCPPQEKDSAIWLPLSGLPMLLPEQFALSEGTGGLTDLTWAPLPKKMAVADTIARPAGVWSLQTVIVDPGHGGRDPGATGLFGVQEKIITLDIARRLASALRDNGLTVELTRNSDEFTSLQERTRLANEKHGDLFISIHCNSNRDKSIHGIETYFLSPARTERATHAALKENSVVQLEADTSGYADLTEANFILQTMATSQNLKDSEEWAAAVAHSAATATGLESRGVDQAGFYVLMGAAMPALLVECGYLSHAGDIALLTSDSGRQKLADALAASILTMKTKLETSASR